jgi:hypothetical protein
LILLALALQAVGPQTAVDAENAFRRAAQVDGQWTAFRKFATEDALIFNAQPEKAQQTLPIKNPPIAVQWWPAESYVSCDGKAAVNTGPWIRPKSAGYFTTVWLQQSDGSWKWTLDHGDALERPRSVPEKPQVRRASCRNLPVGADDHMPVGPNPTANGEGTSPDRSLLWEWQVMPDGHRTFAAHLWTGREYEIVLLDDVAAPK